MPDDERSRTPGRWTDDRCPDDIRDALRRPVDLGPDARARLASALESEPRPAAARPHARRWLLRPLSLPPLALGAAAAALLLVGVFAGEQLARTRAGARAVAANAPRTAPAANVP